MSEDTVKAAIKGLPGTEAVVLPTIQNETSDLYDHLYRLTQNLIQEDREVFCDWSGLKEVRRPINNVVATSASHAKQREMTNYLTWLINTKLPQNAAIALIGSSYVEYKYFTRVRPDLRIICQVDLNGLKQENRLSKNFGEANSDLLNPALAVDANNYLNALMPINHKTLVGNFFIGPFLDLPPLMFHYLIMIDSILYIEPKNLVAKLKQYSTPFSTPTVYATMHHAYEMITAKMAISHPISGFKWVEEIPYIAMYIDDDVSPYYLHQKHIVDSYWSGNNELTSSPVYDNYGYGLFQISLSTQDQHVTRPLTCMHGFTMLLCPVEYILGKGKEIYMTCQTNKLASARSYVFQRLNDKQLIDWTLIVQWIRTNIGKVSMLGRELVQKWEGLNNDPVLKIIDWIILQLSIDKHHKFAVSKAASWLAHHKFLISKWKVNVTWPIQRFVSSVGSWFYVDFINKTERIKDFNVPFGTIHVTNIPRATTFATHLITYVSYNIIGGKHALDNAANYEKFVKKHKLFNKPKPLTANHFADKVVPYLREIKMNTYFYYGFRPGNSIVELSKWAENIVVSTTVEPGYTADDVELDTGFTLEKSNVHYLNIPYERLDKKNLFAKQMKFINVLYDVSCCDGYHEDSICDAPLDRLKKLIFYYKHNNWTNLIVKYNSPNYEALLIFLRKEKVLPTIIRNHSFNPYSPEVYLHINRNSFQNMFWTSKSDKYDQFEMDYRLAIETFLKVQAVYYSELDKMLPKAPKLPELPTKPRYPLSFAKINTAKFLKKAGVTISVKDYAGEFLSVKRTFDELTMEPLSVKITHDIEKDIARLRFPLLKVNLHKNNVFKYMVKQMVCNYCKLPEKHYAQHYPDLAGFFLIATQSTGSDLAKAAFTHNDMVDAFIMFSAFVNKLEKDFCKDYCSNLIEFFEDLDTYVALHLPNLSMHLAAESTNLMEISSQLVVPLLLRSVPHDYLVELLTWMMTSNMYNNYLLYMKRFLHNFETPLLHRNLDEMIKFLRDDLDYWLLPKLPFDLPLDSATLDVLPFSAKTSKSEIIMPMEEEKKIKSVSFKPTVTADTAPKPIDIKEKLESVVTDMVIEESKLSSLSEPTASAVESAKTPEIVPKLKEIVPTAPSFDEMYIIPEDAEIKSPLVAPILDLPNVVDHTKKELPKLPKVKDRTNYNFEPIPLEVIKEENKPVVLDEAGKGSKFLDLPVEAMIPKEAVAIETDPNLQKIVPHMDPVNARGIMFPHLRALFTDYYWAPFNKSVMPKDWFEPLSMKAICAMFNIAIMANNVLIGNAGFKTFHINVTPIGVYLQKVTEPNELPRQFDKAPNHIPYTMPNDGLCVFHAILCVKNLDSEQIIPLMKRHGYQYPIVPRMNRERAAEVLKAERITVIDMIKNPKQKADNKNMDYVVLTDNHAEVYMSPAASWVGTFPKFEDVTMDIDLAEHTKQKMSDHVAALRNMIDVDQGSCYFDTHNKAKKTLDQLVNTKFKKVKMGMVQGGPGCVKTDSILNFMCKKFGEQKVDKDGNRTPSIGKVLFIASSAEGRTEVANKLKVRLGLDSSSALEKLCGFYVKTWVNAMASGAFYSMFDTSFEFVFIDEAFFYAKSYVMVITQLFPKAKYFFIGDKCQMMLNMAQVAEYGNLPAEVTIKSFTDQLTEVQQKFNTCFRFGQTFVKLANKIQPAGNLRCGAYKFSTIRNYPVQYVEKREELGLTCMTASVAKDTSSPVVAECVTVRVCQGASYDRSMMYLNKNQLKFLFNSPAQLYVALTRMRYEMWIMCDEDEFGIFKDRIRTWKTAIGGNIYDNIGGFKYIESIGNDDMMLPDFTAEPTHLESERTPKMVKIKETAHPSYLQDLQISLPEGTAVHEFVLPSQTGANMLLNPEIVTGVTRTVNRISESGQGPNHVVSSAFQDIATTARRQLEAKKVMKTHPGSILGDAIIVEQFMNAYVDKQKYDALWNEPIHKYLESEARTEFLMALNMNDVDRETTTLGFFRRVKEHLKTQTRIKGFENVIAGHNGPADELPKVGQPIGAYEKQVNAYFSCIYRVITKLLVMSLKSKVIWAAGLSMKKIHEAVNAVADWNLAMWMNDYRSMDVTHNKTSNHQIAKILEALCPYELDIHAGFDVVTNATGYAMTFIYFLGYQLSSGRLTLSL